MLLPKTTDETLPFQEGKTPVFYCSNLENLQFLIDECGADFKAVDEVHSYLVRLRCIASSIIRKDRLCFTKWR